MTAEVIGFPWEGTGVGLIIIVKFKRPDVPSGLS